MTLSQNFKNSAKLFAGVLSVIGLFAANNIGDRETSREDDLNRALAARHNIMTLPTGDQYLLVCTETGMANAQKLNISGAGIQTLVIATSEQYTWEPVRARICDTYLGQPHRF